MTGDRLSDLDAVERQRQFAVTFARQNGGRTFLRRQHVGYPFHVGRALYLPGDPEGFCTVYMQSCSGGIFQHERLGVVAVADPDAWAHLTTGAATVVHSMPEGYAEQDVLLDARAGSLIEYVPDALILFPDSRLDARLTIRAHRDATVIAAESFLLHDPRGDRRPFDWLRSETRVEDEQGRVLALDRFRVDGSAMQAGVPGVDGGFALQATLMVVHPQDPDAALVALREACAGEHGAYAGASLLPNGAGAWMRALSNDAVGLRGLIRDAWSIARWKLRGLAAGVRRK